MQGISQSASEEAGYDRQRFAVTISRVRGQWWPVGMRGADPVERLDLAAADAAARGMTYAVA
ncbi:MAG TPA: hypothetical protein PKH97_02750, partial [Tetrasphaera sp.]|uniref:hypothetical protein n=1 Tax=Nostocoides sp. TaxID=1917966 RepID=UPI002CD7B0BE